MSENLSYFEQYEARRSAVAQREAQRKRQQELAESSGYSSIQLQPDGSYKWVHTDEEPSVTNSMSVGTGVTSSSFWRAEFGPRSNHNNYYNNYHSMREYRPQYRLRKTYTFIGDVKVLQDCHIERKDYTDSELWHIQEDVFNEYNI